MAAKATYRGQGSIDFLAACRSAFVVGSDPENPDVKVMCHIKSNLGPPTASLTFTINNAHFEWGEETSLTAEQVLAVPAEPAERTKLGEAKDFLLDMLADGPKFQKHVEKEAKANGITVATLRRAKGALGIKPRKLDMGPWLWELPAHMLKDAGDALIKHNEHLSTFPNINNLAPSKEPPAPKVLIDEVKRIFGGGNIVTPKNHT
jgi:hypothetical protein